jgi:hypothetical protein
MAKTSAEMDRARRSALAGDPDTAISILSELAPGDPSASATLAELFAFKNDWEGVIENVARFLPEPESVYAGNVFDELVRLIALCGHETGNWSKLRSIAEHAMVTIEATVTKDWVRNRLVAKLQALCGYCDRQGGEPHDFYILSPQSGRKNSKLAYEEAVRDMLTLRPDLKNNKIGQLQHQFGLATYCGQSDEAIRLFPEVQARVTYNDAVYVAGIFIERGKKDDAWTILKDTLPRWFPLDAAQVVPLVLLIDRRIRPLMTLDRCLEILQTPRATPGG